MNMNNVNLPLPMSINDQSQGNRFTPDITCLTNGKINVRKKLSLDRI